MSDGFVRNDEAYFVTGWQHLPKGTGEDSQGSLYLGCD